MSLRALAFLIALALPASAAAADLATLRRLVAGDDRAAVERWLAAEIKARDEDPLAALGARPPSQELREKATTLAERELIVSVLALAFVRDRDPEIKRQLLARLDGAIAAKEAVGREVRLAARAPAPPPLVFARLFTAGTGQAGRLAESSSEFSAEEPAIHVRFIYEGGVPGEELQSRWLLSGPNGRQEFAQSAMTLQKSTDRGQFSFAPAAGTRWQEGVYRVEIRGRGSLLAEVDFSVRGPQTAAAPPVVPPPSAPRPAPGVVAPGGPVGILNAVLAKDIENGQPKDPVTEFSTARKRLVLWAQTQGGGALTARWYATDGGDRLLGEHTLAVPPGQQPVVFWLEVADAKAKFGRGRFRIDLVSANRVVQQLPFRVREATFLEELGEALEQFGKELDKAIKGDGK